MKFNAHLLVYSSPHTYPWDQTLGHVCKPVASKHSEVTVDKDCLTSFLKGKKPKFIIQGLEFVFSHLEYGSDRLVLTCALTLPNSTKEFMNELEGLCYEIDQDAVVFHNLR